MGSRLITPVQWDTIWLRVAEIVSEKSKDPEIKVGAVVASVDNTRVTTGFNGFPRGIQDTEDRWRNDTKKGLVIHAEVNAIRNARTDLTGWTLYVTMFPCQPCAIEIIQSGIRRVVYRDDPKIGSSWNRQKEVLRLFKEAKVRVTKLDTSPRSSSRWSTPSRRRRWLSTFGAMLTRMWPSGNR